MPPIEGVSFGLVIQPRRCIGFIKMAANKRQHRGKGQNRGVRERGRVPYYWRTRPRDYEQQSPRPTV